MYKWFNDANNIIGYDARFQKVEYRNDQNFYDEVAAVILKSSMAMDIFKNRCQEIMEENKGCPHPEDYIWCRPAFNYIGNDTYIVISPYGWAKIQKALKNINTAIHTISFLFQ